MSVNVWWFEIPVFCGHFGFLPQLNKTCFKGQLEILNHPKDYMWGSLALWWTGNKLCDENQLEMSTTVSRKGGGWNATMNNYTTREQIKE